MPPLSFSILNQACIVRPDDAEGGGRSAIGNALADLDLAVAYARVVLLLVLRERECGRSKCEGDRDSDHELVQDRLPFVRPSLSAAVPPLATASIRSPARPVRPDRPVARRRARRCAGRGAAGTSTRRRSSRTRFSSRCRTSSGAPILPERVLEGCRITIALEVEQRVVVAQPVLQRAAVRSHMCGMRAPGTAFGHVSADLPFGDIARLVGDQRRAGVGVAGLDTDHAVHAAVIDVERSRHLLAVRRALGRVVDGSRASPARARSARRPPPSRSPRRCARRSAGARSRRRRAAPGPPQPWIVPASFQARSKASPTPVFMPSPPVGMTRWIASPARNTRPSR